MTEVEFDSWLPGARAGYAKQIAEHGGADESAARIKAEVPALRALAKYLPKDAKELRDYLLVAIAVIKLASSSSSHHTTTTVINNFPPTPPAISGAPQQSP